MRALACGAPHTPGGSAGLRALLARTERKSRGEGGECHDRRVGNLGEPERAEGGAGASGAGDDSRGRNTSRGSSSRSGGDYSGGGASGITSAGTCGAELRVLRPAHRSGVASSGSVRYV